MTEQSVQQAYAAFRANHPAAGLLPAQRDQALKHFIASGFPGPRLEEWKYTDLGKVAARATATLPQAQAIKSPVSEALLADLATSDDCLRIVVANGQIVSQPEACDGLRITTLLRADAADLTQVAASLAADDPSPASSMTALNTAFLTDAIIIDVAKGTQPAKPVQIVFVSEGNAITQTRLLVSLGDHSSLTLVEQFVSTGPSLSNHVTDIRAGTGANLVYCKLQQESPDAHHLANQRLKIGRDARVHAVHLDVGAALARNDLTVNLAEPGAQASLFGLFFADGSRHTDNHTTINHAAPNTTSEESYRGVVTDSGRGVFNGRIMVHPGADGTNANLSNKNLLLSKTAEIDTKPELEIYADDVKCSHGATTGQLDPVAIFYLRSRGIGEAEARRMLTLAFGREVLEHIPLAGLRTIMEQLLESGVKQAVEAS